MLKLRNRIVAVFSGACAAAGIFACQAMAAENGSPNTLAYYEPSLVKTVEAYGPLFSQHIPRSSTEPAAPGDFVEKIQAPDGSEIRVLVKAPAPAQPARILKVPSIAPGQTANDYFDAATNEAIAGGYAAVVFPTAVYNFVAPPPNKVHWLIKGAKDLTIDGQGSTLNFASPLAAGVTIGSAQRVVFKGFNIDWPNELMASVGTITSIDKQKHTMRVRIEPQYPVNEKTQVVALSPWDAKSDPKNPHFALKNYYKEQYTNNKGTVYLGNNTFEVPYWNNYIETGDVVMVRHWGWNPWKNAIQTGSSYNLDFENINIYASPFLGFILAGGGGYRLSHCSVTRLNAGRLISSAADAVHISDNTGDIIIEDSTFAYEGDDGVNIHGAVGIFERDGEHSLHWTATGENAYAPYAWTAGTDTIGFFDGKFGFLGTTNLQALTHPRPGLNIELKDTAPAGATQIADLSRVSARFVIKNNKFLYNRPRGLLLQSSLGLVENNEFTGQTGHGIVVGAAPGGEGPGVQNVIFRGNRFSNVGAFPTTPVPPNLDVRLGALIVAIQGGADNVEAVTPVHENLIFDSNTFSDLQGPGLFISRANDVVVVNNQLKNTNLARAQDYPNLGTANLGGSIVVTHAHNVYFSKNSLQSAGPISIDTKSTDGMTR
jgi:Right handed beta helix region